MRPQPGSRLASFQRQYGEDVLEAARAGGDAASAAAEWIRANPPRPGDAWHPYPLSTRIGNWIAALTLDPSLAPVVADSLRLQLAYLARNVEDDVLGNHVIRNARALVLGGASLGDAGLSRRGVEVLRRELPEQVLADGGHYERSPAYHRLVLRDLLEVAAFVDVADEVERMTAFAAASSRPDGAPALFNDGGLDVAPRLDVPEPPNGVVVFPDTGYVFVRVRDLWLAFDCGPPAPPFLPAHAHADALSFQVWHRGVPVVIDPGTYTYAPGADRDWFRSTRAHATVALDGRNQFLLWGTFRSGRLPRVTLLAVDDDSASAAVEWTSGERHVRTVSWRNHIEVVDRIEGAGRRIVEVRLPLAPSATPAVLEPEGASVRVERGWTAERFGEREHAPIMVMEVTASLPTELRWSLRLAP